MMTFINTFSLSIISSTAASLNNGKRSLGKASDLVNSEKSGSRFRVQGSGFKVQGSRFKVQGSGFKVQGSGFRVQGSGFKVQGWRQFSGNFLL
jgi:hypothetical protein